MWKALFSPLRADGEFIVMFHANVGVKLRIKFIQKILQKIKTENLLL